MIPKTIHRTIAQMTSLSSVVSKASGTDEVTASVISSDADASTAEAVKAVTKTSASVSAYKIIRAIFIKSPSKLTDIYFTISAAFFQVLFVTR